MYVCMYSVVSDLCNLMFCSLPGSSAHRLLQVIILEWVDIPFSRGSSSVQIFHLHLLHCQVDSLPLSHQGSPQKYMHTTIYKIGKQQAHMVQGTILNILQQPIKEKKSEKEYVYICHICFNHYPFISPWTFRLLPCVGYHK